jgi:hypothetical protein
MKAFRLIIVYLITALACSPAFAAYCATDCATEPINRIADYSKSNSSTISHKLSLNQTSSESESTPEELPCAMGIACCHMFQATPASSTTEHLELDVANIFPHRYTTSGKSADLSPPLKPPA